MTDLEAITLDVPAAVAVACALDGYDGATYGRRTTRAVAVTFTPNALALFLDDVTTRSNLLGASGFGQEPGWVRACRAYLPKLTDAVALYVAVQVGRPLPRDVERSLRYYFKLATLAVGKRDFDRSVRAGRRSPNA